LAGDGDQAVKVLDRLRSVVIFPPLRHPGYNRGMSEERKRRGALFWTAVGLIGLMLYVLSFGPACWIMANRLPPWAVSIVLVFYAPLMLLSETTGPTHDLLQWYVHLWAENVTV
jgi:hypothetical protein